MDATIAEPEKWKELRIAVIGGDEREQEIVRRAVGAGASVSAFGFPMPEAGIEGVTRSENVEAALDGAYFALMPIPLNAMDGSLFADCRIVPSAAMLGRMAEGAHVIIGRADDNLSAAASAAGVTVHEYEHDRELMLLRAPAIVEGALQIAIDLTEVTIHNARICVVGQGNIGSVLTRTLIALGARVTVAARNPVQRAAAYTFGAESISTEVLAAHAADFDMIMSTVPAPVVTPRVIDRLPAHALVMDLSAPPGGCDLEYAEATGRPAVWARALGRRAPITVGASQWVGISGIISEVLGAR